MSSDCRFCDIEFQVTIRCNKIEVVTANDDRFHRRDILKCVGATIGMVRAFFSLLFVKIMYLLH